VADFNRDGHQDIAVSSSVLLGKGDGTFDAPVSIDTNGTYIAAVADFNGDGVPDLASISGPPLGVSSAVILGRGDGTFSTPITMSVAGNPTAMTAVDLNNDGYLDFVTSNFISSVTPVPNTVSVLLGRGDGSFRAASFLGSIAQTSGSLVSAVSGDFDGDGGLDFVGLAQPTAGPGSLAIWLNDESDSFSGPTFVPLSSSTNFYLATADFNGDAKPDLAVANNNIAVLMGNGDGTFSSEIDYHGTGMDAFLATGDFNGDGKVDLVSVGGTMLAVLLGNGDGTFGLARTLSFTGTPTAIAVGDFNHDGKSDLAVTVSGANPGVSVLLGNGDGSFQAAIPYSFGTNPVRVAVADFNGDGNPDMAVIDSTSSTVFLLLGNGDGSFQIPDGITVGFQPVDLRIDDVDLDGHPDIVVLNRGWNDVSILLGVGDGTFRPAINWGASEAPETVMVGDFNRDGSPDLAMQDISGISLIYTRHSLGLTVAPGGTGAITINPGDIAEYFLSIGGSGLQGTATFTCNGLPAGSTCTVPSVTFTADGPPSPFTLTVSTAARSSAVAIYPRLKVPLLISETIGGLLLWPLFNWKVKTRLNFRLVALGLLLLALGACGGSNTDPSSTTPPAEPGTPRGTYNLTLTATSGSTHQLLHLTLIVK
jgi:hypothetical protein